VWAHTNYDADALHAALPGLVEVRGSDSIDDKECALLGFADGSVRWLMSKPSICGFGLNFQHCARVLFVGVSYSYEQYYQAIRRVWRFGQQRPVEVYVVSATNEYSIVNTLAEKEHGHRGLQAAMISASQAEHGTAERKTLMNRAPETVTGNGWTLIVGDCVTNLA